MFIITPSGTAIPLTNIKMLKPSKSSKSVLLYTRTGQHAIYENSTIKEVIDKFIVGNAEAESKDMRFLTDTISELQKDVVKLDNLIKDSMKEFDSTIQHTLNPTVKKLERHIKEIESTNVTMMDKADRLARGYLATNEQVDSIVNQLAEAIEEAKSDV